MSLKSNLSAAQEYYVCYKLLSLIGKKYVEFDAYKLGLIDEKGNTLRKSKTKEEREAMTPVVILALEFKKTAAYNPQFLAKIKLNPVLALRESLEKSYEVDEILEAMYAGDAADNPTDKAAGLTSGSVVNVTSKDNVPAELKGIKKRPRTPLEDVEKEDEEEY